MKDLYRREVDRLKALNRQWDQQALVQHIFEQVPEEFVKKQAGKFYELIAKAEAIKPLATE